MSVELAPTTPPQVDRFWSTEPDDAARPAVLVGVLVIGLLAALTLRLTVPGSALLCIGLATATVAFVARERRPTWREAVPLTVVVALLSFSVLRSAEWLVALCLLGAVTLGTLTLVGGRTWTGVALSAITSGLAPSRASRWVRAALVDVRIPALQSRRFWLVGSATVSLLGLFGALFTAADSAYAHVIRSIFPPIDGGEVVGRTFTFAIVGTAAIVLAYLAHRPPTTDVLAPQPGTSLKRWEWAIPLLVLDLLFLSFVLVQVTVLFGGKEHVLATHGLTYAEYARQGFWELLVVTVLTLAVIAVAVRFRPRDSRADRVVVQVTLGALCLLALVIVASASHRMALYEEQYGFTRLRLFVQLVELTLGGVFVLLLAAGVRMTHTWLPRAVVGLGAVALLTFAAINPDAYIARENVARYAKTGRIDVAYLSTLSPDAVPWLLKLPADQRGCALGSLAAELSESSDPWYDVNLARASARRLLLATPFETCTQQVSIGD